MCSGHHDIKKKEKADECAAFVSFLDETIRIVLRRSVLAPSVNEHLRKLQPYCLQLILSSLKRTYTLLSFDRVSIGSMAECIGYPANNLSWLNGPFYVRLCK